MIDWKHISLRDLAGFIAEELRKRGIDTILVGGACVTIYSENQYQSYDLDFVTYETMKNVRKVLLELGFEVYNKYFRHKDCPWFVEFVSPPVAIGNEPIQKFNIVETEFGSIKLLRPIDSVKDRLSSFYHWNDKMGLEQAITICTSYDIDIAEVEEWSLKEEQMSKFQIFKKLLGKNLDKNLK